MNGNPRFLADASLSGLAKWLRLLGYDTAVYPLEAGPSMMKKAQESGRILLTRRQDLKDRQFSGNLLFLNDTNKFKQLDFIVKKLPLNINSEKLFTRCLSCNERLVALEKSRVLNLVPQYVYNNCDIYRQCPKCRKIFWAGTHGLNALKYLENHGIVIELA